MKKITFLQINICLCWLIIMVTQGVAYAQQPHLSADADTLYVGDCAIIRDKNTHHHQSPAIEYENNISLNTMWGEDIRLTHLAENGGIISIPNPIYIDSLLAIFFTVTSLPHDYLVFKTFSIDQGYNWTEPEHINIPSVYVHRLAYVDSLLYFKGSTYESIRHPIFMRSFDTGETWQDYIEFEDALVFTAGKSAITALEDNVFITYRMGFRDTIWVDSLIFVSSNDRGQTWSEPRGIVSIHNDLYWHWLKNSQQRLHLVYEEFGQEDLEIYYAHSDDLGETWSTPLIISDNDSYDSQWPYLSCDENGNLCVSWFDYKYGSGPSGLTGDLLYRISSDNGQSWGVEQRLTYDQFATASRSVIDGNNDYVCFAWEDNYLSWLNVNLSFKESFDFGATWTPKYEITNNGPGHDAVKPELLYDGNILYLFWLDDRDNQLFNYEVYFKRGDIQTSIKDFPQPPAIFSLIAYPNPFNSRAFISYTGPKEGDVEIFDIAGRLVTTLTLERGGKTSWDATDDMGQDVSSGIYLIRVRTAQKTVVSKITYLK